MVTSSEKKWYDSKKFLALIVVLVVVLIIAGFGIVFHSAVADIIGKIIAFASAHQLSQGTTDAVGQWKNKATPLVASAEAAVIGEVEEIAPLRIDTKDVDPEAFS